MAKQRSSHICYLFSKMDFLRRRDVFGYKIGGYYQDGSTAFGTTLVGGAFSIAYKVFFIYFFLVNMGWVF